MADLPPYNTNPMRRFILFIGDRYYPGGGGYDCYGSFDTLHDAERKLLRDPPTSSDRWAHVYDCNYARVTHEYEPYMDYDREEEPERDWYCTEGTPANPQMATKEQAFPPEYNHPRYMDPHDLWVASGMPIPTYRSGVTDG